MAALFDLLSTIANSITTLIDMVCWLVVGSHQMTTMLVKGVSMFGTFMRMFPFAVTTGVVGICTALLVLRIMGR